MSSAFNATLEGAADVFSADLICEERLAIHLDGLSKDLAHCPHN